MNIKPKECCDLGSYEHVVPMPIDGRVRLIDYCISDLVAALNAANITTVNSCCGHSIMPGSIILEDGRELIIIDPKKTPYKTHDLDYPYIDNPCAHKNCAFNVAQYTSEVKCINTKLTQIEFEGVIKTKKKNEKCSFYK